MKKNGKIIGSDMMKGTENLEWIARRKEFLDAIKSFEFDKDRIKTTTQVAYMHNAIHESVLGEANWVNGWITIELTKNIRLKEKNPAVLTDKELKVLHDKLKSIAIKFIELDIEITSLINKKIERSIGRTSSYPNEDRKVGIV